MAKITINKVFWIMLASRFLTYGLICFIKDKYANITKVNVSFFTHGTSYLINKKSEIRSREKPRIKYFSSRLAPKRKTEKSKEVPTIRIHLLSCKPNSEITYKLDANRIIPVRISRFLRFFIFKLKSFLGIG